ncbi:MAG: phosphatidylethanolamine N-methyltransferase family protein [Methanoregulaceae archaeon]|nr:phosphatidylethanolamine N-methyltransferase family protein [Methanoregulaceae archaeon]
MIEAALVTILPVGFLIIIFGGGALFLQKKIEQDGEAPINRTLFYTSKYSIIILWGAMALASWGIGVSPFQVPRLLQLIALAFWFAGFALLYLGRFTMGDSFRLGTPKEDTCLKTGGLFRLSRNPMYVGVYATIVASSLYTLNPVVILLGVFVVAVHHSIVLSEEKNMQKVFGQEYLDYYNRVRQYI